MDINLLNHKLRRFVTSTLRTKLVIHLRANSPSVNNQLSYLSWGNKPILSNNNLFPYTKLISFKLISSANYN